MYYGQEYLDKFIHETFFHNDMRNGFFVECGAHNGVSENTCKFFEETLEWKGLNIEPVPYNFDKLIQNRPNCINECYALSSSNGTAIFKNPIHPEIGRNLGCGSLSHSPAHWETIKNFEMDIFEVQTTTFLDLYNKHSLPDIDLFVLDVEGHENEALKGILAIPEHAYPKVFCIEHQPTEDDWLKKLLSPWYDYHSYYHVNALFIKK